MTEWVVVAEDHTLDTQEWIIGPFPSKKNAAEWGIAHIAECDWWLDELTKPSEYLGKP